jgi:adenosylhomocysteine nucleosidase
MHPTSSADSLRSKRQGIVLCPLHYERKQLTAAGMGDEFVIECSGPGRAGIERWFDRNETLASQSPWLLLVGLAGAIDPAIRAGSAHAISMVVNGDGKHMRATMTPAVCDDRAVRIVTSDTLVRDPAARISLHRATAAQLVDQESAAFASRAERVGVRWGIVRGVSDGVENSLPRDLEKWVDPTGRTRLGRVILSLLRSPGDLPRMIAIGRASRCAMREAANVAARLIRENDASHASV